MGLRSDTISALIRRDARRQRELASSLTRSPSPSLSKWPRGDKVTVCKPGRESSPVTKPHLNVHFGLSSLQNCERETSVV